MTAATPELCAITNQIGQCNFSDRQILFHVALGWCFGTEFLRHAPTREGSHDVSVLRQAFFDLERFSFCLAALIVSPIADPQKKGTKPFYLRFCVTVR